MPPPDSQLPRAEPCRDAASKTLAQGQLGGNHRQDVGERRPVLTPLPRDGDVVVTYENRSPACFAVCQAPGVVQLSASTREGALRLARAFAQKHELDLWFREDGTYRLLEAYRTRAIGVDSRVEDACG